MAAPITIQSVLLSFQTLAGVVFNIKEFAVHDGPGLGVPPNVCAVIEDAPAGIAAANTCGMAGIGLASTGRAHQSLANASLVVDSLQELSPALIEQLIASPPSKKFL